MDPDSFIEVETDVTNETERSTSPPLNVTLSAVTWSETEDAVSLPFRGREFEPQLSFNFSEEGESTYEVCTPETEKEITIDDTYYVPPVPPIFPLPPMDLQGYEMMSERQRQHIRSTSRSKLVLEMQDDERTAAGASNTSINRNPSQLQPVTLPSTGKHLPRSLRQRFYQTLPLSCGPNVIALLLVGSLICSIFSLMASEKNEQNLELFVAETRGYRNEQIPSLVAKIEDLSDKLHKLNQTIFLLQNHFNLTNSPN